MDKRTGFLVEELYRLGPLSNQEISRHLDLSPASITNLLGPLVQHGLLKERPPEAYEGDLQAPSTEGRKPRRKLTVTPNQAYGYVLAGDLHATRLEFRKIDFGLHLEENFSESIAIPANKDSFISDLSRCVESIRQKDSRRLLAVGLTVSGRVDQTTQRLKFSNDMAFLIEHDIAGELSGLLGVPVVLTNDANALAIHERYSGKARTMDHFFSLYINEGVGMGIFTHGQLYEGYQHHAGESGHWIIDPLGPEIEGIPRGSFESYVSRKAITHQLIGTGLEIQGRDAYDILSEHAHGAAALILNSVASRSAHLCTNLLHIFAPEHIFISGPLAEIGENFIGRLRTEMRAMTTSDRRESLANSIQLSGNWKRSMALGTAQQAIMAHLERLVRENPS